jgi:hypothetical protein
MADNNLTDFKLPTTGYATFDATSLKRLIIQRLNENKVFTDQNFEGSNLSSIIDIIAYSYHVLLFYLNQTSTESLFSEAQLYENINRIVKSIDYHPVGFQTSNLTMQMVGSSNLPKDTYVIPRYSFIKAGSVSYNTKEDIVFTKTSDGIEIISDVGNHHLLYEGSWKEYPRYTAIGEEFENLTLLPGETTMIDHFNIDIYIKNIYSGKWRQWKRTDSLFLNDGDSEVFEVRLNENKHYELKFGNNITGKKLDTGDIAAIFYLQTTGVAGQVGVATIDNQTMSFYNNVNFLDVFNEVKDQYSIYLTETQAKNLAWTNINASTDFYIGETVTDIKNRAPKTFTSQYRLINAEDYETYLKNKFSNILRDVKVVNNKEYIEKHIAYMFTDLELSKPNADANTLYNQLLFGNSCDFNNIYIYGVPRMEKSNSYVVRNNYLTAAQKSVIIDSLRNNKVLTAEPVIADPVYIAVDIGAARSGEVTSVGMSDKSQLQIIRHKDSRVSKDNIRKQAAELIKKYFKTSELGMTLNFANVINNVTSINGVKSVYTVRTDIENVRIEGINFILFNPVYPDVDIESSSSIVSLPFFKYPYLNDADNFINKIVVLDEDSAVY